MGIENMAPPHFFFCFFILIARYDTLVAFSAQFCIPHCTGRETNANRSYVNA